MWLSNPERRMSTLAKRLKEARIAAGLSQEQLGIEAGLEPASASTRMNRYELGKRVPDPVLVETLADVLGFPASYFYAVDDQEAALLAGYHRLSKSTKAKVLAYLEEVGGKKS
jgi:transcriptional regulator with XRE-family HTH domain